MVTNSHCGTSWHAGTAQVFFSAPESRLYLDPLPSQPARRGLLGTLPTSFETAPIWIKMQAIM